MKNKLSPGNIAAAELVQLKAVEVGTRFAANALVSSKNKEEEITNMVEEAKIKSLLEMRESDNKKTKKIINETYGKSIIHMGIMVVIWHFCLAPIFFYQKINPNILMAVSAFVILTICWGKYLLHFGSKENFYYSVKSTDTSINIYKFISLLYSFIVQGYLIYISIIVLKFSSSFLNINFITVIFFYLPLLFVTVTTTIFNWLFWSSKSNKYLLSFKEYQEIKNKHNETI